MSSDREKAEIFELRALLEPDSAPERVDRYLGSHPDIPASRTRIQRLAIDGYIMVSGKTAAPNKLLKGGETIRVAIPPRSAHDLKGEDIPLDIRYQDEDLAVINKAPGMVVHPGVGHRTGTLVHAMIHHFKTLALEGESERPGIVHRLDRDTSGLMIVAMNDLVHQAMQDAIKAREVRRIYFAIVCGHVKEESGLIDLPVGRSLKVHPRMAVPGKFSREAQTEYTLLERFRSYDLLRIKLHTGRTHQIRVHFSHLGHPVLGDPQYGGREKWHKGQFGPERPLGRELLEVINRQALHAGDLKFEHPMTQKELHFEADPPDDFQAALKILRERGS